MTRLALTSIAVLMLLAVSPAPAADYERWRVVIESGTQSEIQKVPAACMSRYIREFLLKTYELDPLVSGSAVEAFFAKARVTGPGGKAFSSRRASVGETHGPLSSSYSAKTGIEALASTSFPGIHGVVFADRNAEQLNRIFLTYVDILRRGALSKLRPEQAGIALHIQAPGRDPLTFWTFDLARMKDASFVGAAPAAYRSIPTRYREFFRKEYAERLGLPQELIDRLDEISRATEDRSLLFLKTRQSFTRVEREGVFVYADRQGSAHLGGKLVISPRKARKQPGRILPGIFQKMPEDLGIEGGALLVFSKSAEEPLPVELLSGKRIKRTPGEHLVEVSRNVVRKGADRETSRTLIQHLASIAMGQPVKPKRIVIHVDGPHRRLFAGWGFRDLGPEDFLEDLAQSALPVALSERAYDGYQAVDTEVFLENVMKREFPVDSLNSERENEAIRTIFGIPPGEKTPDPALQRQAEEVLRGL